MTAFDSPKDAANDPRILVFGRLLGAANRLEYILGRALEENFDLPHSIFELLLVVGRAGGGGVAVRDIAQARVLTSGGATRLVQRAEERGLVDRRPSSTDARAQVITLTEAGTSLLLEASALHARNIEHYLLEVLPVGQSEFFAESIKAISKNASNKLPVMP